MAPPNHVSSAARTLNEKAMGITYYVSPMDSGLQGDMRKRFTDFLVYEIRKDGHVVNLQDYEYPNETKKDQPSPPVSTASLDHKSSPTVPGEESDSKSNNQISDEDRQILEDLVGEEATNQLIELYRSIFQAKGTETIKLRRVVFPAGAERQKRTVTHHEIRRIFASRIATQTEATGVITAIPVGKSSSGGHGRTHDYHRNSRPGYKSYAELGGEYLHFTLFKENKDTMDAINHIARLLKIKSSNFGFAGTKDRRAATVQRISVYRQRAENLVWLNQRIPGIKVGDFEHHQYPMTLGQHGGNKFIITLKNCQVTRGAGCSLQRRFELIERAVEVALEQVDQHGFLNYFGLQRFGTHSVGTHELGIKILQGDFEGAIMAILHVDAELLNATFFNEGSGDHQLTSRDEVSRAKAIGMWKTAGNSEQALKILPKRFSAEGNIVRHLSRPETKKDFMGALLGITRGMRMMYIHAYQSFVWNHVASYRWSKYGSVVIKGDLVLEDTGEPRPKGTGDDVPDPDQDDEHFYVKARILSAEEIASGRYTIFDIVLPTPGYDVDYPENDVGQYYTEFMGREENGGLNPYNMRRRQREFSLSGNYRRLIGQFIGKPSFSIRTYVDDQEQMYPTDVDIIHQRKSDQSRLRREKLINSKPGLAAWNSFAQNAKTHDARMNKERRRAIEALPSPEGGTRVRETWIEHTLDGNNKRVKVEKHVNELVWGSGSGDIKMESAGEMDESFAEDHGGTNGKNLSTDYLVEEADKPSEVLPNPSDTSSDLALATGGVRLMAKPPKDTGLPPATAAAPTEVLKPESPIPIFNFNDPIVQSISAEAALSETYPNSRAYDAGGGRSGEVRFGKLEADLGPVTETESLTSASHNESKDKSDQASSPPGASTEYTSDMTTRTVSGEQERPFTPAFTGITDAASATVGQRSQTAVTKPLEIPKFRFPGQEVTTPTMAISPVSESHVDPSSTSEAKRVAVTLQFSLRSSNYATIALREIMGAPQDENRSVIDTYRPRSSGMGTDTYRPRSSGTGITKGDTTPTSW